MRRIVLAYSGGLDTSVAIRWLAEQYGAEIVAVTLDLGQGRELPTSASGRWRLARSAPTSIDAREEFAREYILPALQAGRGLRRSLPAGDGARRGRSSPSTSSRSPAWKRATAIAHGCTRQGQRSGRARRLGPGARARHQGDRAGANVGHVAAQTHRIRARAQHPVSRRRWPAPTAPTPTCGGGRSSAACSRTRGLEPPDDIYTLTRAPQRLPGRAGVLDIEFEAGVPVRANGIEMPLLELIESLDTIAGSHGVGRIDMVENRLVGIKSREVYEAPAAVVLHAAHRELENLVIARDLRADQARARPASTPTLVYNGLWFSQTREAIDAFVRTIQPRVTGAVRLKLFKGDCRVVGRKSPFALYDQALATYDAGDDVRSRRDRGLHQDLGPADRDRGPQSGGAARRGGALTWRTSGPDDSTAIPTPRCSSSARRSGSTGACSKTTSRGSVAWAEALERAGVLSAADGAAIRGRARRDPRRRRRRRGFLHRRGGGERRGRARLRRARAVAAGRRRRPAPAHRPVAQRAGLARSAALPEAPHSAAAAAGCARSSACLPNRRRGAGDALMPSYTHLRRAQPILAAHFFLAHAAALRRDHARLRRRASTKSTSCRSARARLPAPAIRSTSMPWPPRSASPASSPTASTRPAIATSSRPSCTRPR